MKILSKFFHYHTWATLQLIDFCGRQPPELLQENVIGTERSILHTLTHLVGSEQEYLETLMGEKTLAPVLQGEILSLDELKRRSESLSRDWENVLARIDELEVTLPADGTRPETPHAQDLLVLQAIQHGIDHRTQICTTLHELGLEPPNMDGWSYFLAMHQPGS